MLRNAASAVILSLLQQKIDCNKRNCQRQQVSQIYHYQSPRLNLLAMIGTLIRVIPVDPERGQTFDGPKFHQGISLEVLERLRLPSLLRIRVKFGWSWMLISRSRYSYSILYSLYIIKYSRFGTSLARIVLVLFWNVNKWNKQCSFQFLDELVWNKSSTVIFIRSDLNR